MKTAVITTGGTIGSVEKDGVRGLGETGIRDLLAELSGSFETPFEFMHLSPFGILSENITLEDIGILICEVYRALDAGCRAVLITHGSDTLSYTANLLGAVFSSSPCPIVLTASFSPGGSEESERNIRDALSLLCQAPGGCYVLFKNPGDEDATVFYADDILQCEPIDDRYRPMRETAGYVKNGCFLRKTARRSFPKGVDAHSICFSRRVLIVKGYPGLNYASVTPDPEVGAVLHTVYHSFTANALPEGSEYSLLTFKKRLDQRGIPLFIAPFDREAPLYESTEKLLKSGVSAIPGASLEAAYARLLLWLNSGGGSFEEYNKLFI